MVVVLENKVKGRYKVRYRECMQGEYENLIMLNLNVECSHQWHLSSAVYTMAKGSEVDDVQQKCRIAEIVQHVCELRTDRFGNRAIHCFPLPRVLIL